MAMVMGMGTGTAMVMAIMESVTVMDMARTGGIAGPAGVTATISARVTVTGAARAASCASM